MNYNVIPESQVFFDKWLNNRKTGEGWEIRCKSEEQVQYCLSLLSSDPAGKINASITENALNELHTNRRDYVYVRWTATTNENTYKADITDGGSGAGRIKWFHEVFTPSTTVTPFTIQNTKGEVISLSSVETTIIESKIKGDVIYKSSN